MAICPRKYYENKRANGGDEINTVKSVNISLSVANNQQVIAAVTGKRIRVIAYKIQSATSSVGAYGLKDGSGGPSLDGGYTPSQNGLPLIMIPFDAGYFETSTGVGLFADIVGHSASLQVYYIEYTP